MTRAGERATQKGLTLVELLFAVAITGLLVAGLAGIVNQTIQAQDVAAKQTSQMAELRFALQRMVSAVSGSTRLILPLADNPATAWREHVREQTVPAQAPESGSVLATAVLAVTLDHAIDIDGDGWSDANNDKDFLDLNGNLLRDANEPEVIDEDLSDDSSGDGQPGLIGIDDDGDGYVDESATARPQADDDEDDAMDEDPLDGADTDGDGSVGEDPSGDMNGDGEGGVAGESCLLLICTPIPGDLNDDDADLSADEERLDAVVYFLSAGQLIERMPSPYDTNSDLIVDGRDYTESVIAEGVRWFKVERLPKNGGAQLLEISLALGSAETSSQLSVQVRVGGGL